MPPTQRRSDAMNSLEEIAPKHSKRIHKPSTHQVRIIGGRWKRTPLAVVLAEGLRPTPDRVRETLFNWLSYLLDNDWSRLHCLDLFAGCGALGLEAGSRGASAVTMVDVHTPAVRQLETVRNRLGAQEIVVVRSDAMAFVKTRIGQGQNRRFDLVFLDPPYGAGWIEKMLPFCAALLAPDGYLYVEAEMQLVSMVLPATGSPASGLIAPQSPAVLKTGVAMVLPAGWTIVRADRAGQVFYHLLQYGNASGHEA